MTEEVGQEPVQQAEINTIEDQAREQGWVPKDEFQGDEVKWVEAGEFIRRGELFKKIDHVTRENKSQAKALEQVKAHLVKVREGEYNRALADLKAERNAARADQDFEKVDAIEERMDVVKAEAVAAKQEIMKSTGEEVQLHPEVSQWIEKNSWYNSNMAMKAVADAVAMKLNGEGITGNALLKGIDAEVRKEFPHKFNNPNRDRASAVEGGSKSGTSKSQGFELSEQENRVMQNLVSNKVMTRDEYIADLKRIKGIK